MREHIIALRRQLAEARAHLVELDTAAGARVMTAEEQTAFTASRDNLAALSTRLDQAEDAERAALAGARPVEEVLHGAPRPTATATVGDPNALAQPGVAFARYCAAVAAGRAMPERMASWYRTTFGTDHVHAALEASTVGNGGILIPQQIYRTIAPLLQARALMRRSGCVVEPLTNGQTTIVRATGGGTFSRVAEGTEVNASTPTFGGVTLTAKKLLGMIPISNDLLTYAPQRVDSIVTEQSLTGLAVAEDVDFLRGNGVGATPKGLRYIATAAAGNLLTMTATPDVAKIQYDLQRLVMALANANVPMAKCFWGFAPRVAWYLQYLLNANGNRIFPEMEKGTLMGFPFGTSTSIPITGGSGYDSEIYLWDAAECVIGDGESLRVDISSEASYKDESGTLVSAFSKDQTVLRFVLANDFAMFHNAGCAVMTGVTWGYTAP